MEFGREAREAIEAARRTAEEDVRGKDGTLLALRGEEFQVMPYGAKGGARFVLAGPEMLILIRAWHTEWCVTVRYRSAGIWGHGLDALRERAARWLAACGRVQDCGDNPRVTRMDYAIDLHAPGFEPSYGMAEHFVFPQGTAKMRVVGKLEVIGRSRRPQTFTLGRIDGLQVQLYDKVAEIREASGKDWFRQLWGGLDRDVWRIECRFSGAWLKERGIRTYEAIRDNLRPMIATALHGYRLSDGSTTRSGRAPVHPLWWRAIQAAGDADFGAAVVNLSTQRREEAHAMMRANAIGVARAAIVALRGEIDQAAMDDFMADVAASEQFDPHRNRKVKRLQERHRWIGQPA